MPGVHPGEIIAARVDLLACADDANCAALEDDRCAMLAARLFRDQNRRVASAITVEVALQIEGIEPRLDRIGAGLAERIPHIGRQARGGDEVDILAARSYGCCSRQDEAHHERKNPVHLPSRPRGHTIANLGKPQRLSRDGPRRGPSPARSSMQARAH
jgi:hypothetical protein